LCATSHWKILPFANPVSKSLDKSRMSVSQIASLRIGIMNQEKCKTLNWTY
jgi:hypothetical protein